MSEIARAQTAGSLDTTFGTGGKVITPIGSANDGISGIAIQTDGKIVAAGYADNGTNSDFAVSRYNTDGTLDTSFGTGGKVITPIGSSNDFASSVAIQTGGKIVVAGYASNGNNLDFAVVRYNTDGSLDTSFGTGGKVTTPIGNLDDFASAVVIQTDGKIVVAGASEVSVFSNDFAAVRYNADGTLDTSFGTGGKVTTPIGTSDDFASAAAIQTDGKLVVAGASSDGTTDDFALVRYNVNGTLDTSFGTGGKVTTPIGTSDDFASAVAIQADGKIIAAGDANNGSNADFALVRYNVNGTLDTSFGTGGKVTTPIGTANDFLYAAAIQSNGKIVAVGSAAGTTDDFAVVRYNADGTLDTSFGTGGKVTTPIGTSDDFASAVAIQADGKIIAAGSANNGTNLDFALARYFGTNPNNPVPTITNLNPNNKLSGSGAFEITVNGTNFVALSVVRFNGQDRATTFVSDTQLKAQILASDIQTPGQFPVTVFNPAPGGGMSNAVNFTVGACSYSITPTSQTFTNAGGSSSTNVTTQAGCSYTAVSNSPFITVTGGASGSGNGTVSFTVAANTGPARNGTITIAGQTFTVLQGDGCTFSIAPMGGSFTSAGGTGSFSVTTGAGCPFAATTNAPFITINNGTGTGSGTVTFTVAANTGADRTGTIIVNGQTFTVTQAGGCTYVLSPTSVNVGSNSGTGSFNVTTGAGCVYTATSNASFITINNGTGTGSGTVTFTVTANTGADRTGTITVNGQTFTVNQSGGCTYSLAPTSANFAASGGTGSFSVTTGAGCTYTATTDAAWITINGGTGTGNGTVNFTVAANSGPDRTGTITVNGQTFTVTQTGGCTYSLAPTSANFAATGGTGSFNVTTAAGCAYTATTNAPFITINSGTGTGSGTVTFTVAANTDTDRTGTITVNGQTFTVTQAGGCAYVLSPTSVNVGSGGGTGSFVVTTGTGCAFAATSNSAFITITSGTGTGSGNVTFNIQANTGAARSGTITVNGQTYTVNQAAGSAVTRTAFDFDGDGKADISVFRPDNGIWYLLNSQTGFTGVQFGISTDRIVPADYDGDGKTDVAVYRDGTWYVQRSSLGFTGISFGAPTDVPAPADFDGDGKSELAVYRPSNGTWYIYNLATNQTSGVSFGASEDKPVAGDYDGDGKADVAVFRPSNGTWYLQRSSLGFTGLQFGDANDKPVPADYDGDGKTDVAVFRPSAGTWYLQGSTSGFTGIAFGLATDLPVPADYDGDAKADVAVFRNGTWYLQRSTQGFTGVAFGAATDKPAPNAFVR